MQAAVTGDGIIGFKQTVCCLLLMLVGVSLCAAGNAASTAAGSTIESLVAEVVASNSELEFYAAEIAAARAGQRAAGLFDDPELVAEVGRKQTAALNGTTFGDGTVWSVSLRQTFEWPGRLGLRKSIANSDVNLAELGLAQFRDALAARARLLGYDLVASQERAAATREVANRFAALLDVLTQRDPAGLTPLLEVRIIEATVLTLQRRAAAAELSIGTAMLELNQLRGMPARTPIHIDSAELVFRPAESLDALLDLARSNNFELRVRLVELKQQGFRVDLTKNERYPSFSVAPFYSQQHAADSERIIGLGISVPLPLRKRNAMNVAVSQARQQQAQAMVSVAQRELERKLAASALAYESKLAEMAKWHADSLEQFRQAAALADRHYRLGAVAVTTYVELQKQYLEAVEALVETKREALVVASELELLTGLATPLVTLKPARD